mmetsp:Transcript_31864/g.46653  ORF Transcript_31864/g.46653 Transcript_31864/m.46653 type:complete len:91 (+) Transcript_31864:101-373(+)
MSYQQILNEEQQKEAGWGLRFLAINQRGCFQYCREEKHIIIYYYHSWKQRSVVFPDRLQDGSPRNHRTCLPRSLDENRSLSCRAWLDLGK